MDLPPSRYIHCVQNKPIGSFLTQPQAGEELTVGGRGPRVRKVSSRWFTGLVQIFDKKFFSTPTPGQNMSTGGSDRIFPRKVEGQNSATGEPQKTKEGANRIYSPSPVDFR